MLKQSTRSGRKLKVFDRDRKSSIHRSDSIKTVLTALFWRKTTISDGSVCLLQLVALFASSRELAPACSQQSEIKESAALKMCAALKRVCCGEMHAQV